MHTRAHASTYVLLARSPTYLQERANGVARESQAGQPHLWSSSVATADLGGRLVTVTKYMPRTKDVGMPGATARPRVQSHMLSSLSSLLAVESLHLLSPQPTENPAIQAAPEPPRDAPSSSYTALSQPLGDQALPPPWSQVTWHLPEPGRSPRPVWAHPGVFCLPPQPYRTPLLRPGDRLR